MKRFVIFVGVLLFWGGISLQASNDDLRIVETRKIMGNGHPVLVMEVSGKTNFQIERGSAKKDYTATHAATFGDKYLFFGYVIEHEDEDRLYNGFILMADCQGEVVFEEEIDLGHDEEIVHVKRLDDMLVLHIQQWRDEAYEHVADHFLLYEGNDLQESVMVPTRLERVEKHREILYLSEKSQGGFELALNRHGDFLTPEEALELEKNGEYDTGTTFHFLQKAFYEGEEIIGPLHFDYPGHFVITMQDETYDFTIHPQIEGVKAHETRDEPFSITIDAGQPFLNNTAYASGETISEPGYHLLKVAGMNGYEKKVPFTLTSGLSGVESHTVHENPLTLSFMGEGRLNGESIDSGMLLAESGSYVLEIAGKNGYLESHHFELDIEEGTPGNGFVKLEMILVGVTAVAVGLLLYRLFKKP